MVTLVLFLVVSFGGRGTGPKTFETANGLSSMQSSAASSSSSVASPQGVHAAREPTQAELDGLVQMGMPSGATPAKKPEIHDISAALEKLRSPFTPNRMTLAHILLQMRTMASKVAAQPHKRPRVTTKPQGVVARGTKRPRTTTPRAGPGSPKGTARARRGAAPPKLNKHGIEPCNCKKSRCLKLYCQCFAAGQMCDQCNCNECKNQESTSAERDEALRQLLERNPTAFESKITASSAVRARCRRRRRRRRARARSMAPIFRALLTLFRLSSLLSSPCAPPPHTHTLSISLPPPSPVALAGRRQVHAPLRVPLQEVAVPEELLRVFPGGHPVQ